VNAVWANPLWQELLPLGRDETTGGYRRYTFTEADSSCRDWFLKSAGERFLRVECDEVGNLWAWWLVAENLGLGGGGGTPVAPAAGATPRATDMPSPQVSRDSDSTGADGVVGAVVAGSHLDSVPDGGAFDGPLGVVSAFLAIDQLRERGFQPVRPIEGDCRYAVGTLEEKICRHRRLPAVLSRRGLPGSSASAMGDGRSIAEADDRGPIEFAPLPEARK